jgi:hypothetical protein
MRYMTHVLLWCFLVGGIVTWTPTRAYAAPIAAPNIAVTNGGFEDATTPTGWTVVQSRTDLGVTSIAGCATVDNTPYGTLQTYTPVARPAHDNYVLATNTHTAAVTNLVKASGLRSMQLRMTATSSAANSYFVAHGSHMYSSQFNANAGQEVNLEVYGIADNVGSLTSDMDSEKRLYYYLDSKWCPHRNKWWEWAFYSWICDGTKLRYIPGSSSGWCV